jgi:hypothetical protein
MSAAQAIVLVAAAALLLAGVVPLLAKVSAVIAGDTPARRVLDAVWTALPIAFLVTLIVWVAAS